jgi:hypothetical protein
MSGSVVQFTLERHSFTTFRREIHVVPIHTHKPVEDGGIMFLLRQMDERETSRGDENRKQK